MHWFLALEAGGTRHKDSCMAVIKKKLQNINNSKETREDTHSQKSKNASVGLQTYRRMSIKICTGKCINQRYCKRARFVIYPKASQTTMTKRLLYRHLGIQ